MVMDACVAFGSVLAVCLKILNFRLQSEVGFGQRKVQLPLRSVSGR